MRYMLLVKATPEYESGRLPDEQTMSAMATFTEELFKSGAFLGAERLEPTSKGTRIHYGNGRFRITDGPFAEAKELIAGFSLIQAKSLEEAIEWAKRVPFEEGEVEIRQLFELPDFPVDPAETPDGWRKKEEELRAQPPPARKPGTTRYIGLLKADRDTEGARQRQPE